MKLIFCPECQDMVRLFFELRKCKCGASGGVYTDKRNANIYGKAIPIGIDNSSLLANLRYRNAKKRVKKILPPIECFLIADDAPTVHKKEWLL